MGLVPEEWGGGHQFLGDRDVNASGAGHQCQGRGTEQGDLCSLDYVPGTRARQSQVGLSG